MLMRIPIPSAHTLTIYALTALVATAAFLLLAHVRPDALRYPLPPVVIVMLVHLLAQILPPHRA
jgi:hypothetical protein